MHAQPRHHPLPACHVYRLSHPKTPRDGTCGGTLPYLFSILSLSYVFFFCQWILLGSHQLKVHLTAHPRICSSIFTLGFGQFVSLPIGKLLSLGYTEPEDDPGHLLDTLVLDSPFPDYLLKIHKGCRHERMLFLQTHTGHRQHCRP